MFLISTPHSTSLRQTVGGDISLSIAGALLDNESCQKCGKLIFPKVP